jgi:hypothetical protein
MGTNREPSGQLQGCSSIGSGVREENGPFQGSLEGVVFLSGAGYAPLGQASHLQPRGT